MKKITTFLISTFLSTSAFATELGDLCELELLTQCLAVPDQSWIFSSYGTQIDEHCLQEVQYHMSLLGFDGYTNPTALEWNTTMCGDIGCIYYEYEMSVYPSLECSYGEAGLPDNVVCSNDLYDQCVNVPPTDPGPEGGSYGAQIHEMCSQLVPCHMQTLGFSGYSCPWNWSLSCGTTGGPWCGWDEYLLAVTPVAECY